MLKGVATHEDEMRHGIIKLTLVNGQLGHEDKIQCDRPTVVSKLSKYKITKAGAGRSHIVVVTEDGHSLAFGWTKHGQLGSSSIRNGEFSFVKFIVYNVSSQTYF
ncbi:hypothetical protein Pint_25814 [Pistacia integerrima]|uniref:Uncharacterized protein n=1 Tax=Pistacia integerrima TaxID=434235 RepID=A0ACC0YH31_9ROSI|nr:hypothetical protein Pint_25814 [Pistacia integerrima]